MTIKISYIAPLDSRPFKYAVKRINDRGNLNVNYEIFLFGEEIVNTIDAGETPKSDIFMFPEIISWSRDSRNNRGSDKEPDVELAEYITGKKGYENSKVIILDHIISNPKSKKAAGAIPKLLTTSQPFDLQLESIITEVLDQNYKN